VTAMAKKEKINTIRDAQQELKRLKHLVNEGGLTFDAYVVEKKKIKDRLLKLQKPVSIKKPLKR
jgi:hypothetical protein